MRTTEACDCPAASAAALRLPASTMQTKVVIAFSLSTRAPPLVRLPQCSCQLAGIEAASDVTQSTGMTNIDSLGKDKLDASPSPNRLLPGTPQASPARITAYDHIGIRVSDRQRALSFYEALGFRESARFPDYEANEMVTEAGVRINLIFNGARRRGASNVLLDEPIKLPGITHPAFIVDDLAALHAWLQRQGIVVTEGPHPIGPRRVALFIRDPDGNVLEFDQLIHQ